MSGRFTALGPTHLVAIAAALVAPIVLSIIARGVGSPRVERVMRLSLAFLLILAEGNWLLLLYRNHWFSVATVLPMHLCDWAAIVVVVTLLRPNPRTYELSYFWALGGTLQALLTPDLAHDFPDPRFVAFFTLHAGVIASALYLTLARGLRPVPDSLPRVAAWSTVYLATAALTNLIFGTNFGYLRAKPAAPSLMDWLSPWPYYLPELVLIGGLVLLVLYTPFFVIDLLRGRRTV